MKKQILHILMSDYSVDSRVKNQTESLSEKYQVTVMCLRSKTNNDNLRNGVALNRHGMIFKHKIMRFISAYLSMFFSSIFKKVVCIQAHDMNALPLAYLIAKIKGIPLIYDSHELWAHSHHANFPCAVLKIAAKIERFCAKRADEIITVSDSIARHLEKEFEKKHVSVVKNVPSYVHKGKYDLFRQKYSISLNTPIFLYQGLITEARGAKLIFDAISKIDKKSDYIFVFLGNGSFLEELKELVSSHNLTNKVKVEGFVPQGELLKYTASADIGVHALDRTCLNHEYCLPNKVFEYIHSGIGMICPDLVELTKFIEENSLGAIYKSGDVNDLRITLEGFIDNPLQIEEAKYSALKAQNEYNWSVEEKILLNIYSKIA